LADLSLVAETLSKVPDFTEQEKRIQSEDRAHRIGQKNNVTYIDIICEKTVDENIVSSLRNKIDLASQSLGETLKEWLIESKKKKK
jgi:SNF2 family DNA or RNA helicase